MKVITDAPIFEEQSNAKGKNWTNFKNWGKDKYGKIKEAGAFPVIENLLGLGKKPKPKPDVDINPKPDFILEDDPKPKMKLATKIIIGVVAVGVIVGVIYLIKRNKKGSLKK
jgi:hypothetical protein